MLHVPGICNARDLNDTCIRIEHRISNRVNDIIGGQYDSKIFLCKMDELSDEVCLFIDLCQFLQQYHPEKSLRLEAYNSLSKMKNVIQHSIYNNPVIYCLVQRSKENIQDSELSTIAEILLRDFRANSTVNNPFQTKILKIMARIRKQTKMLDTKYCSNKSITNDMFCDPLFIDLISTRRKLAKALNYSTFSELIFNEQRHMLKSLDAIRSFLEVEKERWYEPALIESERVQDNTDFQLCDELFGFQLLQDFCKSVLNCSLQVDLEQDYHTLIGVKKITGGPTKIYKLTLRTLSKEMLGNIFVWIDSSCSSGAVFPLRPYVPLNYDCLLRHSQHPVVVIVCPSFVDNKESLKTLFHEFGHALHHILWNRSPLQLLSGTRYTCIELLELASIWTERKISQIYNTQLGYFTASSGLNRYLDCVHAIFDLELHDNDNIEMGSLFTLKNKYLSFLSSKPSSMYHHIIHTPASYYMYPISEHIVDNIIDNDVSIIQKYMTPFQLIPQSIKDLVDK